jgi:CHAT domain-containing protein
MTSPLWSGTRSFYAPSMRVLVACIRRLEAPSAGAERSREWKAALFAAYNDNTPNGEERNAIYASLRTLGERLGGTLPSLGGDLDADTFSQRSMGVDLIVFHGHGEVSEHHPDQQSLVFGHDRLTLASAASLDLRRAPHVSIVACWGGKQDFSLGGDEQLGLPVAFLAARASSVVGPLWPIRSETGRAFTQHFFDQPFVRQEVDRLELGPLINLAEAVGRACNALRTGARETASPYHWAAFALHGA